MIKTRTREQKIKNNQTNEHRRAGMINRQLPKIIQMINS